MTSAAGRNVATAGLSTRGVTAKTGRVRVEVRGNRHRHPAARGPVTGRTIDAAHREVTRMIELHAEADQSIGKWLGGPTLRVGVTNGADGTVGI